MVIHKGVSNIEVPGLAARLNGVWAQRLPLDFRSLFDRRYHISNINFCYVNVKPF